MATDRDYTEVTELPGSGATNEQLERLYHRYHTARKYAEGRRVLEVASGVGFGLGYFAEVAQQVVGGDYTNNLLKVGASHYGRRVPMVQLDGQYLPFTAGSFDLAVIFEAIYYLPEAAKFVAEACRVLGPEGILVVGTVNRNWDEFAPSPFSTHYLSAAELRQEFEKGGFSKVEFYGAFPTGSKSLKQRLTSLIRKMVVRLDLMPKTLEGRERFKRIFYGDLEPMPAEIRDGMAELSPLVPVDPDGENGEYKIIYAIGHRSSCG